MSTRSRVGRGEGRYIVPLPEKLKPVSIGEHWTSYGKATQVGYRYCEGCSQPKPKNRRPLVKGWRCNDCVTTEVRK